MVREMMQNELELAQRDALAEREGCSADRRDSVAGPDCSVNGVTELVMYVTIRTHAPRRCLRVQGRSFKDLSLWEPASQANAHRLLQVWLNTCFTTPGTPERLSQQLRD
jgi:hypothetical protein